MTDVPAATPRSLFRQGDFAKLWSAATISLFGTQISTLAIPFIAAVVLRASPGEVGLLTTINFLPFILFTLPAGVWVDRMRRRPILIAADLGRALLLLSIPVAWWAGVLSMPQLYVVGFLTGVLTVFFDVADMSYLPSVVGREQLVEGNAKLQMSASAAQVLGQPVGGGLIAAVTAPVAMLIDVVSYLVSAVLILFIRRPEAGGGDPAPVSPPPGARASQADDVTQPAASGVSVVAEAAASEFELADRPAGPAEAAASRAGMRAEVSEGLRYILGHRYLSRIAATTGSSNLFSNIAFAIFPVYAYVVLALTPAEVGLIGGAGGAGVLLGALLSSKVAAWLGVGRAIVSSILLGAGFGLLLPLASLAPRPVAVVLLGAGFFLSSIANVIYNVNQVSLRQAITPDQMLGRMNATMRFLVWGTIPIGSLIGAGLAEVAGVTVTVWVGAVLGLLAFLPAFFSPLRTLKRIPTPEEAAAT